MSSMNRGQARRPVLGRHYFHYFPQPVQRQFDPHLQSAQRQSLPQDDFGTVLLLVFMIISFHHCRRTTPRFITLALE